MGVANTFTFGGISTSAYGLVVEGSGDYSAPKRAVESITIPGRNGAYILDKGYYENTDVEYRVVVTSDNHGDFLDSIEAFRNAIVSLVGYQRLEDTYHPGEYRMAAYSGGLEEAPTFIGKNAVFKVKFDCKPQRWLTSGETKQTIASSGDTITNPTLFASAPLLEVEGDGDITFNDSVITIQAAELGAVQVYGGYTTTGTNPASLSFEMDMSRLNIGDTVTLSGVQINNNIGLTSSWPGVKFDSLVITETTDVASYVKGPLGSRDTYVSFVPISFVFNYGTPATSTTTEIKASMSAHRSDGAGFTGHFTFTSYIDYDGDNKIDMYFTGTSTLSSYFPLTRKVVVPEVNGDSTISTLPTPVYIDLDIGEAYGEYSDVIASVNNAVILPAELPTLAPGSNTITFDNTITDLKVVPRWWRV